MKYCLASNVCCKPGDNNERNRKFSLEVKQRINCLFHVAYFSENLKGCINMVDRNMAWRKNNVPFTDDLLVFD